MNKETLMELLNSAENELENYYTTGSDWDIEATERYCADLERQLVSVSD